MRAYPKPIQDLTAAFSVLPGVGPKTALRYVFHLLKQPKASLASFAHAVEHLQEAMAICAVCRTYTTDELCEICRDPRRDRTVLCVVAHPRDVGTLDAAGFPGRYHVLGGVLSPLEGMTPDVLEVASLFTRLTDEPALREVVLAFNPDVDGEATMMYLSRQLKNRGVRTTRLARGLPVGSDLEFADEVTLGDALKRRWDI